tara:strand:+ start:932 stop:1636 length:705 start_codon:yes stop_codon:yes gene_type:complete
MAIGLADILAAAGAAGKRTTPSSGGDARLMRGSIETGGRPSASFRKETQTTPPDKETQSHTQRADQLAAYAAALADKDYMRADFGAGPLRQQWRDEWAGIAPYTGDPIRNTELFSRRYGNESYADWDWPSILSGPPNTTDYIGNLFPSSHFPSPEISSQFGPYSPPNQSFFDSRGGGLRQPMVVDTPEGRYYPIGLRDYPSVAQINRARMLNAIRAKDHWNRGWAAGPSYGGGY